MDGKELADYAELQQDRLLEVVKYTAEGRSKSWIKNKTGVSYKEQDDMRKEFAHYSTNDSYMQYRSREATAQIDLHYSQLLEKFYAAHDDAVAADDYKTQNTILASIAKVEKDRVDFLTKAGMLAADGLGDRMVENDEKIEAVKTLLIDVAKTYPETKKFISQRLAELDGTVTPSKVVGEQ